jgi:xylulokinase
MSDSSGQPRFVLAIDNGSQSTKVHIVDERGQLHASAQRPLRPHHYPAPGRVVHPDDDLWDSIAATCRQVLRDFGRPASEIAAVGLCTIRFCRALLGDDGRLVEPVLSWMDDRVSKPHVQADPRVTRLCASSGYVTNRLTGRFVDSAAAYQGVWPIDIRAGGWSADPAAYAHTGMSRDQLPELVAPGHVLGTVTAAASRDTGIASGTPVIATANDKAVEALGAGLTDQVVLLSLGTYIAAMTAGRLPDTDRHCDPPHHPDYWINAASMPGQLLFESRGIRRGMWTVSWIRDVLSPVDTADVRNSRERALDTEADQVAPGADGLVALMDWLAPSEAPYRRGALLGFDGRQGRGHVYRSVLEGIAVEMASNIEAMERALDREPAPVIVTGGGAKSDLMMRIIADVLGRQTQRARIDDAAGLGAAICAMVGARVHDDWQSAISSMVKPGDLFTPDPETHRRYRQVRARYAAARRRSDLLFQELDGVETCGLRSLHPL